MMRMEKCSCTVALPGQCNDIPYGLHVGYGFDYKLIQWLTINSALPHPDKNLL